jgi:hypothetical protein
VETVGRKERARESSMINIVSPLLAETLWVVVPLAVALYILWRLVEMRSEGGQKG